MNASIVIGTYGDESWADLARRRALPSAEAQGCEVIHVHGDSLHEARNEGARRAQGEWLCFLDADDSLAPGYVSAILKGTADLRTPAVQWIQDDTESDPVLISPRNLWEGNWLIIGTALRRGLFWEVGGFRDWPCYDDWDLWLRCWFAGATIEQIPEAVYRACVNPSGRNNPDILTKRYTTRAIRRYHLNDARRMGFCA